jgi:hypothetical protein
MKVTTSTGTPRWRVEQLLELDEALALQLLQHHAHVLAHRQLFAR